MSAHRLPRSAAPAGPKSRPPARAYGSVVLASVGHFGGQGSSAYSQRELWAPSGVPEVNTREMPKVMETEDIAAVIEGFAGAARLAVAAGLAGVEVNAGQHSLVRQFLSGLTNTRTDGYGTDRLRFAREVLDAVRQAARRRDPRAAAVAATNSPHGRASRPSRPRRSRPPSRPWSTTWWSCAAPSTRPPRPGPTRTPHPDSTWRWPAVSAPPSAAPSPSSRRDRSSTPPWPSRRSPTAAATASK